MYWRILVPLDRSKEAEGVLPLVREHLMPEGEAILLHVTHLAGQGPSSNLCSPQANRRRQILTVRCRISEGWPAIWEWGLRIGDVQRSSRNLWQTVS